MTSILLQRCEQPLITPAALTPIPHQSQVDRLVTDTHAEPA